MNKNNKGFINIIVAIIIVFVIFVLGYSILNKKSEAPVIDSNNQNQTSTAPSETSDWQTYHNDQYGFEFKYPKDWEMNTSPPNNSFVVNINKPIRKCHKQNSLNCYLDFGVRIEKNEFSNLNQALKKYFIINNKSISVGGISAFRIEYGIEYLPWSLDFIFIKDGNLYTLQTNNTDISSTIDLIVSTFKFTN